MKKHVPPVFLHKKYDKEYIRACIYRQKKIHNLCKHDNRYKDIDPRLFIIFDECYDKVNNWAKDINTKKIFWYGKHIRISFIISFRCPQPIPAAYFSFINYIFIFKPNMQYSFKRKLYDYYNNHIFPTPTYKIFEEILLKYTTDYGCLVIDNNCRESEKIEDNVYWYKVNINKENFDIFKTCDPIFLKFENANDKIS